MSSNAKVLCKQDYYNIIILWVSTCNQLNQERRVIRNTPPAFSHQRNSRKTRSLAANTHSDITFSIDHRIGTKCHQMFDVLLILYAKCSPSHICRGQLPPSHSEHNQLITKKKIFQEQLCCEQHSSPMTKHEWGWRLYNNNIIAWWFWSCVLMCGCLGDLQPSGTWVCSILC